MLILIAGGSCSGKTTLAGKFENSCVVSMDNFYLGKSRMKEPYNFDEPSSVNLDRLFDCVLDLKKGKSAVVPLYSMLESEPMGVEELQPQEIIIVEGIFVLLHKKLRELADIKVFLEISAEERLRRMIERDVVKGRNKEQTLQHAKTVEAMYKIYGEHQKHHADLILKETDSFTPSNILC